MDHNLQAQPPEQPPVDVQLRGPFKGQGVLSAAIIALVVVLAVGGALALVVYLSVR